MDGTVLIADDDKTIRTVLTQAVTRTGCRVHATSSLNTLMRWVEEGRGDVVISDVVMPDGNGLETLPKIHEIRPGLPVIIISAQNTLTTAIGAAEGAAFDHLSKPFDLPDLLQRLSDALDKKRLKRNMSGEPLADLSRVSGALIGHSAPMQKLFRSVAQVINLDLPVLLTGETGTGKTAIAKAIFEKSERGSGELVLMCPGKVNHETLLECLNRPPNSTLLIDGIDDCSPSEQLILSQGFDQLMAHGYRIISTTTNELSDQVSQRKFRADLYYRLSALTIFTPPLRERDGDLVLLVEQVAAGFQSRSGLLRQFSAEAITILSAQDWPGNLRELENAVLRLCMLVDRVEISASDVRHLADEFEITPRTRSINTEAELGEAIEEKLRGYFDQHHRHAYPKGLYDPVIREIERPLISMALDEAGGNQQKTAEMLGINRNTLRKKINDLEIEVTRRRKMM